MKGMIQWSPWVAFALVFALSGWGVLMHREAQSQLTFEQLIQRIEKLESENRQDYRSIHDLYQRIQLLEQRISQVQSDSNRRLQDLTRDTSNLKSQVSQLEAMMADPRRRSSAYPRLRGLSQDRDGNVILDFVR